MYVDGSEVVYTFHEFDPDDQTGYEYSGRFSSDAYRVATEELKRAGKCTLEGEHCSMVMNLSDAVDVEILFTGTPSPSASPGGTPIKGMVRDRRHVREMSID